MKNFKMIFSFVLVTFSTMIFCSAISGQTTSENPEKPKYGLFGTITAKEGKAEELLAILLDASKKMTKVEGCHLYVVSRDPKNKNVISVYEVWDSKDDHDNSLNIEEVRRLIAKALPMVEGPPVQIAEVEVFGGKGIDQ
ncbi:MAG: putative quinol monooxygenase [Pyrinomonadaceae bacterium]